MNERECPYCKKVYYLGSTDEIFDYLTHVENHTKVIREVLEMLERTEHDWDHLDGEELFGSVHEARHVLEGEMNDDDA